MLQLCIYLSDISDRSEYFNLYISMCVTFTGIHIHWANISVNKESSREFHSALFSLGILDLFTVE